MGNKFQTHPSCFPFARQWPVTQPPLFGEATSHQQSGSDGGFTIFQAGAVSNRATNPPSWPPDQPEILAALPGPTESSSSPKNSPTEQRSSWADLTPLNCASGMDRVGMGWEKKTCHHDHETMIYHGDVCRNVDQEQRNR